MTSAIFLLECARVLDVLRVLQLLVCVAHARPLRLYRSGGRLAQPGRERKGPVG